MFAATVSFVSCKASDDDDDDDTTYASYEIVFERDYGNFSYTFRTDGTVIYSAMGNEITGRYSGDPTKNGSIDIIYVHDSYVFTVANNVLTDNYGCEYPKK